MIDFRYYLVSIVSIFLALAVGIVLGAGPLEGDIGSRLTEQITALRTEKAQLRTDLDSARRDAAARDAFSSAVAPAVMQGRLTGRSVALVLAPGVDADLVKDVAASLAAAGAKVGATVTLTDEWTDPAKATLRNTVATPLAGVVKAPLGANTPDQLAATVLARAILTGTNRAAERLTATPGEALNGLKAAELITVTPDLIVPSTAAVVLGGPVKGSSQQDSEARLEAYVRLVRVLKTGASGVVVAARSESTDGTRSADLVAAVRRDSDAAKVVSTVDDAELPMGQGTLVLALAQQYKGSAGQYGLAADAKAIVSELSTRQ